MSEMFKKLEELKKTQRKGGEVQNTSILTCSRCSGEFPKDYIIQFRKKNYCQQCHSIIKEEEAEKRKKQSKQPVFSEEYKELIEIEKKQIELLQKIAISLEKKSSEKESINIEFIADILEKNFNSLKIQTVEYKNIIEINEVKSFIKKFIRGKMPGDRLPSGRNHRTFRIDNFLKRMQDQWKILIDRELVESAKEEMERERIILPTAAAGKNTRYVLKEFIEDYTSKITKKDKEILTWLTKYVKFMNKDFTKIFYSKNNPIRPSDHDWRSANRKLKVLLKKQWIELVPNSRPKEFLVNKEVVKEVYSRIN
ncbi:MAG: hypothetical protein EAX96_10540 [Candidatus Lokiarchaeota archaeon]|nr:hypothetical protein [Candidatus Lokiarchaeota archaeon]